MPFKCAACGKFIPSKDFERNNVEIHYIPDTYLLTEKIEYVCSKCLEVERE